MNNILTNWAELQLLNHILGIAEWRQPRRLYIGLLTGNPGEAGSTAREVAAPEYARAVCASWETNTTGRAKKRATRNLTPISFPLAATDWGLLSHWTIFDAPTGGNPIAYGEITEMYGGAQPGLILAGMAPVLPESAITLAVPTGGMSDWLAHKVLDHICGSGYAETKFLDSHGVYAPVPLYVGLALSGAIPADDGSGIAEPGQGSGYGRVPMLPAYWDPARSDPITNRGVCANRVPVFFERAETEWGRATHVLLHDAFVGGNLWFYAPMTSAKQIDAGSMNVFKPGKLQITVE